MLRAIIYTSHAGHTREYAELFGRETGLTVYSLKEGARELCGKSEVIYLGWLLAGEVRGCREAMKRFDVKAVCGVGMGPSGSQLADIRQKNALSPEMPVFCLQGGFEMEKVRGVYRFMMKCMRASVGKQLAAKAERSAEEEEMLELLTRGADRVSAENARELLDWVARVTKKPDRPGPVDCGGCRACAKGCAPKEETP